MAHNVWQAKRHGARANGAIPIIVAVKIMSFAKKEKTAKENFVSFVLSLMSLKS